MEKKSKKTNKKEFLEWLLIIITGIMINAFCFLLFSCSAKAESPTITPLPYYVNYYYSNYFHLNTQQLNVLSPYIANSSNQVFWLTEPTNWGGNYNYTKLCAFKSSDLSSLTLKQSDLTTNVDYNSFDINDNYVVVNRSGGNFVIAYILINKTTGEFSVAQSTLTTMRSANLLHLGTKSINSYGFTENVPFVFQGENPVVFNGSLEQIVFCNGEPLPPEPEDENITSNTVKPSWNSYSVDWSSNKPTFDSSNAIESLFDYFSWFSDNIGDTLSGGWNFLVDSLDWALQTFLNNVRQKFNEVKEAVNDFADLVEDNIDLVNGYLSDIKDKISDFVDDFVEFADLFIHPFDSTEFESQMANSDFFNAYDELQANAEIIQAIFDNAEERDHFSLYISFENPFADSQHRIIASEINFDWLVPLRSVYRPFLWVCTLIELFVGGARVLSHALGGKGV